MIETPDQTNQPDPATSPGAQGDDIESGSTDAAADNPPSVSLQSVADDDSLLDRVISGMREVFDPEIPLNIYDLGLIYRIDIDTDNQVAIDMTLTSPNCPVAGSLPGEVENAARGVAGVADVVVELVWDPPWDPQVMSEAARLELGLF
jgi:FeS assembly SUF system protein